MNFVKKVGLISVNRYLKNFFIKEIMNKVIVGVDEAGRGPLAGRVYAAAVILNPLNIIEGLKDSKILSEQKRFFLYHEIQKKAHDYYQQSRRQIYVCPA